MNYRIIKGALLFFGIAFADGQVKEQYAQQIKAIKEHLEEKLATCANEKQCACYQKSAEYYKTYQITEKELQILMQLSPEEQQQLITVARDMIDNNCTGKVPHEKWSKKEWELILKIERLQWQQIYKRATPAEQLSRRLLRERLWFMKITSLKDSHEVFQKDWIRSF